MVEISYYAHLSEFRWFKRLSLLNAPNFSIDIDAKGSDPRQVHDFSHLNHMKRLTG